MTNQANDYFCNVIKQPYIYLAPLEGYTEIDFRNVFARHFGGVDAAVAPFVSLMHHDLEDKRRSWDIPHSDEQGLRTIPQFMGRNVKDFKHLAKWVKFKGYEGLNWNLGCPSKRVVRRGRGSGLLQYPDEIRYFLDEIFKDIEVEFSIKTRLGLESPEESYQLFEIYNQYPLKEIILHPRLGTQMYKGEVMLEHFEEILHLSKNEIVYNGDINNLKDYQRIIEKFPSISRIMLGRGLMKDPFLAERIKELLPSDLLIEKERFLKFHDDLCHIFEGKFSSEHELLGKLKDYWRYFSFYFNDRNEVFKYLSRSHDLDEFQLRIHEIIT